MDSNHLPEKKKRGRKSKKELEALKNLELEIHEEDNEIKQPKKISGNTGCFSSTGSCVSGVILDGDTTVHFSTDDVFD